MQWSAHHLAGSLTKAAEAASEPASNDMMSVALAPKPTRAKDMPLVTMGIDWILLLLQYAKTDIRTPQQTHRSDCLRKLNPQQACHNDSHCCCQHQTRLLSILSVTAGLGKH